VDFLSTYPHPPNNKKSPTASVPWMNCSPRTAASSPPSKTTKKASSSNSSPPKAKDAELWNGDILFITPTDISEESKYQHNTQRTVAETQNIKILPCGSIVYTCIASIGKMAITVAPSITNQQINSIVVHPNIRSEFLYYSLANLTPWIKSIPASSTLPIINKSEFSKILLTIPKDEAEQQIIADCLSALDALITAQTNQIAALHAHKKGLMQQLFPNPQGVA